MEELIVKEEGTLKFLEKDSNHDLVITPEKSDGMDWEQLFSLFF